MRYTFLLLATLLFGQALPLRAEDPPTDPAKNQPAPAAQAAQPAVPGLDDLQAVASEVQKAREWVEAKGSELEALEKARADLKIEAGKDSGADLRAKTAGLLVDVMGEKQALQELSLKMRAIMLKLQGGDEALAHAQGLQLATSMLESLIQEKLVKPSSDFATESAKVFADLDKPLVKDARKLAEETKKLLEPAKMLKETAEQIVKVAQKEFPPLLVSMRLQGMGIPPRMYTLDPASGQQKVVQLYDLQSGIPTPVGNKLYEVLKDPKAVVSEAKLHRLLQLADDMAAVEKDKTYKAFPELGKALMDKAFDLARQDLRQGESAVDLSIEARPLSERLAPYRKSAKTAAAVSMAKAVDDLFKAKSPDFIGVIQEQAKLMRFASAIDTLNFQGTKPLLTDDLHAIVQAVPEGELTERQWQVLIESFPMGKSLWKLRADKLWRQGLTGEGVTVAVLDTGIDKAHPDFAAGTLAAEKNLTYHRHTDESDADSFGKDDMRGGHGTHVASTIHAIAPRASILNIKVLDEEAKNIPREFKADQSMVTTRIVDGLEEAARLGARLVSMSLGLPRSNTSLADPDMISRKVKELAERGVTVVVASGNEGDSGLRRPGYLEAALSVGAADYFDRLAAFSSKGDVVLPKEGKVVERPDVLGYGVDVRAAKFNEKSEYGSDKDAEIHEDMDGTSMATPHVSGVAALLAEGADKAGIKLSPEDMKAILKAGADPLRAQLYYGGGAGIINPQRAYEALLARKPVQDTQKAVPLGK